MEDERIVQLYWDRDEAAIAESSAKYGAYCTHIAYNILQDTADTEECVNDTWLRAWQAMPPNRPAVLSTFLGKITRNLCFDRYQKRRREKRGGGSMEAVLDELAECVSGGEDPERRWETRELLRQIDRFLLSLPQEQRYMFLLRYWYADSVADIAARLGRSDGSVSTALSRLRGRLRTHLAERGFDL